MAEIITYEAIFDESVKGVFGISLVENPATQEYFVTLSEDEKPYEIKLATIDEEKRILLGLVLEPNKPIYRNEDGEEFNIIFNSETVANLAHGFFLNGYQLNSSIEHDDKKIKDIAFVESWIVDDPKRDKSNAYGMEYQKGSWVIAMKINDESLWTDYVKTGKVKGFSIDAMVKLKKVNNQKQVKMSVLDKLKTFVGLKSDEVVLKFGQVMLEGGDVIFEYEGETLAVGSPVFAIDKADPENKIPAPVGKFPLEDGSTMVVTEEGIVGEIIPKEAPAGEKPAEPAPAPKQEAMPLSDVSESINSIKSILVKYEENQTRLEAKIDAMNLEFAKVKTEVVTMAEQPVSKPKVGMANIPLNKQGRILDKIRNNS